VVQGAAMATVTHNQIYREVRAYLLGLFSCPPSSVIQGYQNDAPLPNNAIVMTILFEHSLDVAANYYEPVEDKAVVQQSVEITMQIDFYGEESGDRARKLCNLWKNHYTTARLSSCQPLCAKDPMQMTFINEQSRYEQRWMVELTLQYNPEFEHEQTYLDMPVINLLNP
jgi:hypothetical protein